MRPIADPEADEGHVGLTPVVRWAIAISIIAWLIHSLSREAFGAVGSCKIRRGDATRWHKSATDSPARDHYRGCAQGAEQHSSSLRQCGRLRDSTDGDLPYTLLLAPVDAVIATVCFDGR